MGAIVAGGIYDAFTKLQDYLLPTITAELIFRNLSSTTNSNSCTKIISGSIKINPPTQSQLDAICSHPPLNSWTYQAVEYLIDVCDYTESKNAIIFRDQGNLTRNQFQQLCDFKSNPNNFGSVIDYYNLNISNHYNCSSYGNRCSEFEIAA